MIGTDRDGRRFARQGGANLYTKFSLVNIWYSEYQVLRMPAMIQSPTQNDVVRASERDLPAKEVALFLALLVVPFALLLIPALASF